MCLDLGEPVKFFHIGNYSTELISMNLAESSSAVSEVDLHQANVNNNSTNNPAFELALDSSSASIMARAVSADDYASLSNPLCFVYVSALTNRICLMQVDIILAQHKLRAPGASKLKYKCENVFSLKKNLNQKLVKLLDENKDISSEILSQILYSA
jgi:hypothetical protein